MAPQLIDVMVALQVCVRVCVWGGCEGWGGWGLGWGGGGGEGVCTGSRAQGRLAQAVSQGMAGCASGGSCVMPGTGSPGPTHSPTHPLLPQAVDPNGIPSNFLRNDAANPAAGSLRIACEVWCGGFAAPAPVLQGGFGGLQALLYMAAQAPPGYFLGGCAAGWVVWGGWVEDRTVHGGAAHPLATSRQLGGQRGGEVGGVGGVRLLYMAGLPPPPM